MAVNDVDGAKRADAVVADWLRSNIPVLVLIGGVFANQVWQNATVNEKLDTSEKYRASRSVQTDGNFEKVNGRIDGLVDIPVRVRALEEQQKSINDRLDRIADAVINGQNTQRQETKQAFDALSAQINVVGTKVEVLSSRLNDRAQKTGFPTIR